MGFFIFLFPCGNVPGSAHPLIGALLIRQSKGMTYPTEVGRVLVNSGMHLPWASGTGHMVPSSVPGYDNSSPYERGN
ncbi:hypothetical protein BO85DRAFT_271604 [Aspergillus piperis CBS 112811]|uniref:Uncharacterized protein n=1 Tax=Aspergillus piperis CBS 112811 TaxID=1448313 RepID=A0A8G1R5W9_9EURO|nr:hypothetical protein BO85DRAFT_271604 [Aspergillus piperis CBS 112811]RAH58305.1 hypothetical protein BO85DRAFT_271604 [Aspergillus piperis CBS 112811]